MLIARPRQERGFALVLFAVTLVFLLIMVAIAVDLGLVYNARRNDQNAVDVATLAGAQELSNTPDDIIEQVETIAHRTLDLPLGTLDFNSCAGDPGALDTVLQHSDGTLRNCITRSGQLLRVQLPTQQQEAFFGVIAGRTSYDHDAFAIAGLTRQGFGGVLPFSLFTGDAGHVCLRTDNNSSPVSPCAGTGSGDSGLLDFTQFGEPSVGTTENCQGQGSGTNGRLANNVAVGVDHDVDLRPSPSSVINADADKCNDRNAFPNDPNGTETNRTAGASQGLALGMFSGTNFSDGGPARLKRQNLAPYADPYVTVEGHSVDSTGLWEYIADAAETSEIPDQCERSEFEAVVSGNLAGLPLALQSHFAGKSSEFRMEKMLERCFELYLDGTWNDGGAIGTTESRNGCTASIPDPCVGILFGRNSTVESPEIYDIQLTPRFAYVPLAWEAGPDSNFITFQRFVPVFIQRLCVGNQQCNQGTFSPGVPWTDQQSGTSNDDLNAVSAFAFSATMLPGGLGGDGAPFDINVNVFIRLVR